MNAARHRAHATTVPAVAPGGRRAEGRGHGARRRAALALAGLAVAAALAGAGCAGRRPPPPIDAPPGTEQRGIASWYGPGFHGNRTANGEVYDMHAMTAAHKTLPFGTVVEVRNLDNGRRVRVRINDRGPFIRGRIIDLSRAAAEAIGMIGPGTARVEIEVLAGGGPIMTAAPAPVAGGDGWIVQAGAFLEPGRARDLARRLRRDYPGVEVVADGGWHRVVVGPFSRRSRAEAAARRLESDGVEAIVRPAGASRG